MENNNSVLLEMKNICKSFPGVKALDNVSLTVKRGTVHALMGENGAGKSTLMKCLFGIYSKDSGQILLNGKEVSFKTSKEALEHGVAMVHQVMHQEAGRGAIVLLASHIQVDIRSHCARVYQMEHGVLQEVSP